MHRPPDCVAPCTELAFAPMQIYIVLAITVATFAWLLKPPLLLKLTPKGWWPGAVLVLLQCIHLWTYTLLDQWVWVNPLAHFVVIALYLGTTCWTIRCIKLREQELQDPFDEEFQKGWHAPEFDEE